ncbi:MAG: DUF4435 domain-containing protein [Pyrinomonadaceae bacterium]
MTTVDPTRPILKLPNRKGIGNDEQFSLVGNVVITGANGAGKSRLGSWIESNALPDVSVHRISAQRALILPEFAQMKSLTQAENGLFYGYEGAESNVSHKMGNRWASEPDTHMLNDYDQVLSALFAREAKRNADHSRVTKEKKKYIPLADSEIDTIVKIWKNVMPQRSIVFDDGRVTAQKGKGEPYHAKRMSDGERVGLYLIGQCLLAPNSSIIVIDEPEIHLHRSIMERLWDKVEELCPNKLLVYITHDLDFAAGRVASKKFWIREYRDPNSWLWDEVPEINDLPDKLTMEIIGSRRNVLFVEGDSGSIDLPLYRAVFPKYHIVPRGPCQKVIESTKAIRGMPSLHHLTAYGIIDRDFRTDIELTALKDAGVHTVDVAEVENLFCIEPLLRVAAKYLALEPDEIVANVTDFIINELKTELDVQVCSRAERQIQFRLNAYSRKANSIQGLQDGITDLIGSINISTIYKDSRRLYHKAIKDRDLHLALGIYNRKSLSVRIAKFFGMTGRGYVDLILRLLGTGQRASLVRALKAFTPGLSS